MNEQPQVGAAGQVPDAPTAKLEHFTSVIVADAMTESKVIYDEIRREIQAAMSAAEDEALGDAFRYIKTEMSKISTDCGRRVSQRLMEKKRERHKLRTEMSEEVFADVRARLEAFTKSPEYIEYMTGKLGTILEAFGADTVVYLRAEDSGLEPRLKEQKTPYHLRFEQGHFQLGGMEASCPSRKLHVNESFDAKLEDLRSHFASLFGLKLDM